MGGDAPQQSIGMDAIAHSFRVFSAVGRQPRLDPGLLLFVDQALNPQIPHSFVAAASTEDEIDRGQHVPFGHLGHHKADRWRLRLRWLGRPALALVPFGCTPDFAVGMKSCSGLVQQGMKSLGTAEAELQRHRSVIAEHQRGGAVDLLDPIGELPGVGHSG